MKVFWQVIIPTATCGTVVTSNSTRDCGVQEEMLYQSLFTLKYCYINLLFIVTVKHKEGMFCRKTGNCIFIPEQFSWY